LNVCLNGLYVVKASKRKCASFLGILDIAGFEIFLYMAECKKIFNWEFL
jgi:myosin heavy subunit